MTQQEKAPKSNRRRRFDNGFRGGIIVFIIMSIRGFFGILEGFNKGYRVLHFQDNKLIYLTHGEQFPLIWLFTGEKFFFSLLAGFTAMICFWAIFTINPDLLDDIAKDYKREQKK